MEVSRSGTSYKYPPLRSLNGSRTRSYVRFHNLTGRIIDLIWVNFSGVYVCYQSLESGQYIDINTFKNHPWIAFDHCTKDRMHLNKNFVYEPQTALEYFQERYPNSRINSFVETRILVRITLPVYSLRFASLLSLKNKFDEPDEVDHLELPRSLLDDLKKVIKDRNNNKTLPLLRVGQE